MNLPISNTQNRDNFVGRIYNNTKEKNFSVLEHRAFGNMSQLVYLYRKHIDQTWGKHYTRAHTHTTLK